MLYIRSLYTSNLYNLYIKSLEASMLHTWNFVPFNQHLPISPTLPCLVPAVLFSASMYLTVLDTTCEWDYEDFFSSCVWLISLSIMPSHPHMLLQMARSPFVSLNNIHIMYIHIHIYTNIYGLPWWLSGKESTCNTSGFDSWVGKSAWRRKWQHTPVFLPGKSMNRGTWWATVHRAAKIWTQLSNWTTKANTYI